MSDEFVLDTESVIALTLRDAAVFERLEGDVSVLLSSIVVGERFFGACRSRKVDESLERAAEISASNTVPVCDVCTARHYGRIEDGLREIRRPTPEYNTWIAALARQYDLTPISRDTHFDDAEGLEVRAWR